MAASVETYDLLARLFAYPTGGYRDIVLESRVRLADSHPGAAELLRSFEENTSALSEADLEELFTRTFDLNPVCCPEVGWQLFGERYDRGSFLVWMRAQLREFGLSESGELPDHLLHVLSVLGRMEGDNACRFATDAVGPALARMIPSLEEKENPYAKLMKSVQEILTADFGPPVETPEGAPWSMPDAIGMTHHGKGR